MVVVSLVHHGKQECGCMSCCLLALKPKMTQCDHKIGFTVVEIVVALITATQAKPV